jgi:hypothetical protein
VYGARRGGVKARIPRTWWMGATENRNATERGSLERRAGPDGRQVRQWNDGLRRQAGLKWDCHGRHVDLRAALCGHFEVSR